MFANNKVDAYLALRNPKEYATFEDMWADSDNYDTSEGWKDVLEKHGHDGARVVDDTELGGTSYIAFSPEQIKSTGNIGTFKPESGDIRFSRAEDATSGGELFLSCRKIPVLLRYNTSLSNRTLA